MSERGLSVGGAPHLRQRALAHSDLVQHMSEPLHDLPARLLEAEQAPRSAHRVARLDAAARSREACRSRAKLLGCDPSWIAQQMRQRRRPGVAPRRFPDRVADEGRARRPTEASLHCPLRPKPHLLPEPRGRTRDARGLMDTQCCLVAAHRSFHFDHAANPLCPGRAHEWLGSLHLARSTPWPRDRLS